MAPSTFKQVLNASQVQMIMSMSVNQGLLLSNNDDYEIPSSHDYLRPGDRQCSQRSTYIVEGFTEEVHILCSLRRQLYR
jgi:hypothetical protein